MNSPDQLREIFLTALAIESEKERQRYLDETCREDLALRERVVSLLNAHDLAGDFMRDSTDAEATHILNGSSQLIGTTIGPYELLDPIGEGGMGVVFRAVQSAPVQREVALKLIKPGMDSQQIISRFEAERQALAMMDHPNIAKVLDAGTTEEGRPFFVMELVKGHPITRYCDDEHLDLSDRLNLFRSVCQAVQHAHQKGIIHRDIKPSNVLVTLSDDKPLIKVIDFGVAKALHEKLTEHSLWTGLQQVIGTPMYMSPEQADQKGARSDIDTRTDVYSLGVLLYELLTGTTPFDREQLKQAGMEEVRRIISEEEPARPSTRISTLGETLPSIAAVRRLEPKRLTASVRGDLDWIVMKALEKDRERRYATADALADDLERYLQHEPVEAGPPSRIYRLRKFARRHKGTLAAGVLIAGSLVFGIIGTSWKAIEADLERDRALTAEGLAESRLNVVAQEQRKAQEALVKAEAAEQEQRRLREEAEARELYLKQLVYTADIRMAAEAWKLGDVRSFVDLLDRHQNIPEEVDLRGFEWGFLRSFGTAHYRNLPTTEEGSCLVRFLGDGRHFLTGHYSGRMHLYDVARERKILTLPGHSSFANGVDLSPDGLTLASIGDDGFLRLWDLKSGKETAHVRADAGHGHRVYFVLDGKVIISSGEEPRVKLWDASTLEQIGEFGGFADYQHQGVKTRLACSPDRSRCVAADGMNTARVYDLSTRETICTLDLAESGFIRCLEFSEDGRFIAGGRQTHEVTIWDAGTGKPLKQFPGHLDDIQEVSFHPSGDQLVSCDRSGVVRFWWLADLPVQEERNPDTGQSLEWPGSFLGHEDRIWSLDFAPDGKTLITACRDGSIRIWPAQIRRRHKSPATKLEPQIGWLTDTQLVLTTDDHLLFWDLQTQTKHSSPKFDNSVQSMAVSTPHQLIITGHFDGTTRVWNSETGNILQVWHGHEATIHGLAISADGQTFASSGEDGRVLLRRTATGEKVKSFQYEDRCKSIAFSSDGRFLAVAVLNDILLHDLQDETKPPQRLNGHLNSVDCLAFDSQGRLLASGSDDRTLRLWDVGSRGLFRTIQAHKNKVESLTISPDGKTIVSGDKTGTLSFTHTETGRLLYDMSVLPLWHPHEIDTLAPWVSDLKFSPDGSKLAMGIFGVGYIILEGTINETAVVMH